MSVNNRIILVLTSLAMVVMNAAGLAVAINLKVCLAVLQASACGVIGNL